MTFHRYLHLALFVYAKQNTAKDLLLSTRNCHGDKLLISFRVNSDRLLLSLQRISVKFYGPRIGESGKGGEACQISYPSSLFFIFIDSRLRLESSFVRANACHRQPLSLCNRAQNEQCPFDAGPQLVDIHIDSSNRT